MNRRKFLTGLLAASTVAGTKAWEAGLSGAGWAIERELSGNKIISIPSGIRYSKEPWYIDAEGNISYTGTVDKKYTVLEFHRYLQDLADDPHYTTDSHLDIMSHTPSYRYTDNYIMIPDPYTMQDNVMQHLSEGTIETGKHVWSYLA